MRHYRAHRIDAYPTPRGYTADVLAPAGGRRCTHYGRTRAEAERAARDDIDRWIDLAHGDARARARRMPPAEPVGRYAFLYGALALFRNGRT